MLNPEAVYEKYGASSGACSAMVLIRWPDVSSLFFTKLRELWEYATVACDSAKAFVCFTGAGRRA